MKNLFFKFGIGVSLSLGLTLSLAHAGDLMGSSQKTSENKYELQNTAGKVIYSLIADEVKNVSLRDGFGIIQNRFNHVSVLGENGSIIADSLFGEKYRVSKALIGVYNPGYTGKVVNAQNETVYSGSAIKGLSVAQDYFGLINAWSTQFEMYNAKGTKLWAEYGISTAQISNAYAALISPTGEFTLRTAAGEIIEKDQSIKSVKLSDQFAAFIGSDGWLRVYSAGAGSSSVLNLARVKEYGVFQKYFYVEDQFGIILYDLNGRVVSALGFQSPYQASSQAVVFKLNTGSLMVVGSDGTIFTTTNVDQFQLGTDLLATKSGPGLYQVFSLRADTFGKSYSAELSNMQNSTVTGLRLGISTVGILFEAQNRAEVRLQDQTVLKKSFIGRLDLSVDEESLNVNTAPF